jgi:ferric-dicitrate binding protein FerR (iron transport regulator)
MVNMKQIQTMPSQDADAWVSALLDGELDDAEGKRAFERMRDDAGAAARWRDYCLVSDALHGDAGSGDAFMARFRSALDAEPTVLAPMPARKVQPAPYLWTAAAAAAAAITWTVWTAAPQESDHPPMAGVQALASNDVRPAANDARPPDPHIAPYLAAHQDYAYSVVSMPDMVVEKVSLAGPNR